MIVMVRDPKARARLKKNDVSDFRAGQSATHRWWPLRNSFIISTSPPPSSTMSRSSSVDSPAQFSMSPSGAASTAGSSPPPSEPADGGVTTDGEMDLNVSFLRLALTSFWNIDQ